MARIDQSVAKGYPPECAAIKALFHQQSYRNCIQACRGLLRVNGLDLDQRPLHKSFVLFYLALCHDEMARVMHHASVTKVPAFDSAEQFYLDALASLPTKEECRTFWEMRTRCAKEDPFVEEDSQSEYDNTSSLAEDDSYDARDVRKSAAPHFAFFSHPQPRHDSLRVYTPTASPHLSAVDMDDLESHDSFSQLMTPNRLSRRDSLNMPGPDTFISWKKPYTLPREQSRMSLIDPKTPPMTQGVPRTQSRMSLIDPKSPPLAQAIPREYSRMSLIDFDRTTRPARPAQQTLMRPIRLGSPAKPYSLPPQQPASTQVKRLSCRIPQRISTSGPEDMTPRWYSPELVSPVSASPVRSSPVSVISVDDFPAEPRVDTPVFDAPVFCEPEKLVDKSGLFRLHEHVEAMRIQLKTHVMLVHHAKRQLERARAARDGAKKGLSLRTGPEAFKTPSPPNSRLQKSRSFWSFVPEDAKKAELQRRIQAGKERKWARKRFSPERYQNLCEVALDEL